MSKPNTTFKYEITEDSIWHNPPMELSREDIDNAVKEWEKQNEHIDRNVQHVNRYPPHIIKQAHLCGLNPITGMPSLTDVNLQPSSMPSYHIENLKP